MTFAEFDSWIEQHYGELLAVARQRVAFDAEDVLHSAVARMYDNPDLDVRVALHATSEKPLAVWPWAVGVIRSEASTARRTIRRNGTKHLPAHFRGEESTRDDKDTKVEERGKLKRLSKDKDALRYADGLYLKKLEQDRRDFDMDGYGRTKADRPFEVRLPGEPS